MKVTLRDTETLLSIPPLEVAAYLRANGWREVQRIPDVMSTWLVQENPNRGPEILLPLNRSLRDYALRMGELLSLLERFENRSQLDILRDILNTTGDLVRIRLARADLADGSVPLDVGVNLVQGVRDMVAAAAWATVSPRPFFLARPPGEVTNYLQRVRMGQTEHGSYVVTVVSRVTPNLQLQLDGDIADPFERRVMLTLANGLQALKDAADTSASHGDASAFQQAIASGVSANLCEAVSDIAGDQPETIVDVGFTWSPARPVRRETVTRVLLSHDRVPYIKEASKFLRTTEPVDDVELRGAITKLERTARSGPGDIVIYAIVDRQRLHVRIHLTEPEYVMATQAHSDGRTVLCRGTLAKEGMAWVLQAPHGFTVDPLSDV